MNIFLESFSNSITVKNKCIETGFESLESIGASIVSSLSNGGTLFLCGNGGSAADAQHLSAELLVRLRPHINRRSLPAISLALDTSTITACANDYSFEDLFSRNLEALGRAGDCLLAISTSGNSENIIRVLKTAKKIGVGAYSFLGGNGGECLKESEISFLVPSSITSLVQEVHITAGHALMEFVENELCDL